MSDTKLVQIGVVVGCVLTTILVWRVGLGAALYLPWMIGLGVITVNFFAVAKTIMRDVDFNELVVFVVGGIAAVLLLLSSFFGQASAQ